MPSITQPAISSLGIGSNIDSESIVQKLMSIEQQPINNIKKASTALQTDISAYGQIQSSLSAMQTAAQKLNDPSAWNASSANSSDATVATVSAANAGNSSHTLSVSQLASAQSLSSAVFTDPTQPVGQGTLSITLGTWSSDQGSFSPKAGKSAVNITITSTDSLNTVKDKINSSGAGVTASIVNDATGSRLVMRSSTTGASNGFRVSSADASLSKLSYDPSSGNTGGMALKQPAGNAQFNLDGLDLSSESNTLTGVADGMTITLLKTSSTAVSLNSSADTTSIKKNITDFVTAYNNLMNLMQDQTKYDASTKTAGPLQGDAKAIGLQQSLRSLSSGNTTLGNSVKRLADIGLDPGQNGALTVNSGKLDKALSNLSDLKSFFTGVDSANANNSGFAQKWTSFATKSLAFDGAVTTATAGLQKRISDNDKQISDMQDHLSLMETRLRASYTALDTKMGDLNGLKAYVAQQFGGKSN